MSQQYKRRKKLIKPRLQLWMTLTFVGISALALLLQFVLFTNRLTSVALELPNDSDILAAQTGGVVLNVLMVSCILILPLVFIVGILTTFRVAGPIHRIEMVLRQVIAGEKPRDFRLRKSDQLQVLAQLVNEATAPLRKCHDERPDTAELDDVQAPLPSDVSDQPSSSVTPKN
jgi:hypothetical protein